MIDFRSLGYFLITCEQETVSGAAEKLGIAPSTLSSSMSGLAHELGVELFHRLPSGLYPRASARWLYRAGLPLIVLERFGRRVIAGRAEPELVELDIRLSFSLGWVSRAVSQSLALLAAEDPGVLVRPIWSLERSAHFEPTWLESLGFGRGGRVILETLMRPVDPARGEVAVVTDRWVLVNREQNVLTGPRPIFVPSLPPNLHAQIGSYIEQHVKRKVTFLDEPPGALPRLLADHPYADFVVPESLVAPRLGLQGLTMTPLDPPLTSVISARVVEPGIGADRLMAVLTDNLAHRTEPTGFTPILTVRRLHYFNSAFRLQRISAAAREANVTQPALSEQLRQLEISAGASLFERSRDGLAPTPAGVRFAPVAAALERGMLALNLSGAAAKPSVGGRLSLGVLPSVNQNGYLINRIADALASLKERYPALDLVVHEASNGTLQDWITRGTVGLAVVETALPQLPRLFLGASEGLAAISDPRHHLLPAGPVRLEMLLAKPLVLPSHAFGLRQLVETAAREQELKMDVRFQIDSLSLLVAILGREPVCTVLPPSAVERELEEGVLTAHPIIDPQIERRLYVIYSGNRSLTEAERALVDLLRVSLTEARS